METENRIWGNFIVHMRTLGCVFKTLIIEPNKRLSYQYHDFRSEVWCVGSGFAKITKNGIINEYKSGDIIFIEAKDKHRAENIGSSDLIIYEMQYGTKCDENDITRIPD